jgi:outer membrane protein assembly factor BamA
VAMRARAGVIGGGQQTNGARLPPPQERLYVGGETSVRGFRQNELGPLIYVTSNDTVQVKAALNGVADTAGALQEKLEMRIIPAGGNAMYVGNLEYRLPGPFLKTLQTILFVDAGALSTSGIVTLKGSNQFRFTPGVAFKYFSPVGPIQINLGYNKYNLLEGPAFSDQFTDLKGKPILQCLREGVDNNTGNTICLPVAAIAAPRGFFRRITLSVSFPPDF